MDAEFECIACNVKRIVIAVTPVARGYVMRSLECPQCSDLFRIVVRHRRSHASYRAAFVDSGDVRDNKTEMAARADVPRAPCKDRASEKSGA
jgi:transcription elongation factor Elf1